MSCAFFFVAIIIIIIIIIGLTSVFPSHGRFLPKYGVFWIVAYVLWPDALADANQ